MYNKGIKLYQCFISFFKFVGCPEPIPNHAKNCVEMGLGMITAIRQFDEDRNESVNMRVRYTIQN